MLEEPKQGEPQEEPKAEPTEAPEKADETPKLYDGPIKKFAGKPLEELEKSYQSLESEYDKTVTESKKVKEENDAYKQWYQNFQAQQAQVQQQQQQYQQQQQQQGESQVDFYDKPTESFQQLYRQNRAPELRAQDFKNAYDNLVLYELAAVQRFPQVFEGKDLSEVRNLMANGLRSGNVQPEMARDPEMWAQSMRSIEWRNSGFTDPTQTPNPTAPPVGETPMGTRPMTPEPNVTLSPEMKDFANIMLDGNMKKAQELADDLAKDREEGRE